MKITDVQAIPLQIPQKLSFQPSTTGIQTASSGHVLVKVVTDQDVIGYGEAWRLTPAAVSTFVEEALKPCLVGENPLQVEKLWHRMYHTTFRYGRKGLALNCISGVEIALWDILGKYRKLPVYEMLGGACHDRIRTYASLPPYERPEDVAADALRCVEEGYDTIKLHQTDIESVRAARRAIGDDVALAVDINGIWTPREAVERIGQMAEYGVLWVEEPVAPMDDYDALAFVRDRVDVRIAAGENEYTHYGFKQIVTRQAVDILQPDVIKSGGLAACRKILALAEAWNLQLIPHSYYYGPGVAATAHFVISNMSSDYMEIAAVPEEAYFIRPAFRPEKGYLPVPTGPGLGIELDEEVIARYRVT